MLRPILALAVLIALGAPAVAQQKMDMPGMTAPPGGKSGMDMGEVTTKTSYHPGLGELMTAFVQPHHVKLALAGAARNWPLAAYELGELRETFEDVGKLIVKHDNLQIAPAIAATVKPAMDEIDKAIKAKDGGAFSKAYAGLTEACNACHKSADHAMIVIKVPDGSSAAFPDQDFNPPK